VEKEEGKGVCGEEKGKGGKEKEKKPHNSIQHGAPKTLIRPWPGLL